MAFTTTQQLDNVLLRGLTFRTPANAAISSQYTLYANGFGQTYWSNSVSPTNLSSMSTTLGIEITRLSTSMSSMYTNVNTTASSLLSNIQFQSTQITNLTVGLLSTTARLLSNDAVQSNSILSLSNSFIVFSNSVYIQLGSFYTSTLEYVNSTINSISTITYFNNALYDIMSTVNNNYSTLSSYITVQNIVLTSTTQSTTIGLLDTALISTNVSYTSEFETLAKNSNLDTFSSVITSQLLSTSFGLIEYNNVNNGLISSAISSIYHSTVVPLQSTVFGLDIRTQQLELLSTNLSSISNNWISTFVSSSQFYQNEAIYGSINVLSNSVNSLIVSSFYLTETVNAISSSTTNDISELNSTTLSLYSTVLQLQYEFSVITTSSILAGIYDTFMQLEDYTSTLIGSTIASTDTFKSSLYYSTILQNMSISEAFFSYYVSTLYESTLSTVIPSTIAFTSSMVSDLYSTSIANYPPILVNAINSTNSAVYSFATSSATTTLNAIEASTTSAYNAFVDSLSFQASNIGVSSLYTSQTINVAGSNFTGTMDLQNYRNFTINVYGLCNGLSNYRITYTSNDLSLMNYYTGIITLNISTVGSSYSNNNSALRFDVYRWGLPGTVFGNIYPYISNADYLLQYQYTILNRTLYTNLLNVYPRVATRNAFITPLTCNVFTGTGWSSNVFWRGTDLRVSWSNYSFFPFQQLGSPTFNPDILIDLLVNNSTVSQYGPYPLTQSTAIIQAPYILQHATPVVQTTARVYVAGKPFEDMATASFSTIVPSFNRIQIRPSAGNFVAGTELVGIGNNGTYPFFGATTTVTGGVNTSFGGSNVYSVSNLVNGILNQSGHLGASTISVFTGYTNNPNNVSVLSLPNASVLLNRSLVIAFKATVSPQASGKVSVFDFNNGTSNTQYLYFSLGSNTQFQFVGKYIAEGSGQFTASQPVPGLQYVLSVHFTTSNIIGSLFSVSGNTITQIGANITNSEFGNNLQVLSNFLFGRGPDVSNPSFNGTYQKVALFDGRFDTFVNRNEYIQNLLNSGNNSFSGGVYKFSVPPPFASANITLNGGASFNTNEMVISGSGWGVMNSFDVIQGNFVESSASTGSPNFLVNLPNYFESISTLQKFNSAISFTIRNSSNSYTFLATSIAREIGNTYRLRNPSISKTSNTFTTIGQSNIINFSYSPIQRNISTIVGEYTEQIFVGPESAGIPAPNAVANITIPTASALSTVLFYNILNTPISNVESQNMEVRFIVDHLTTSYYSTVLTTVGTDLQQFRF